MHCNVTFVQETSEFFRTNNQWLCTCTAPQHVLQLQRFSHPSVLELIIDFACYENRYINNFSTKLTTYPYYAARSFLKGSGASCLHPEVYLIRDMRISAPSELGHAFRTQGVQHQDSGDRLGVVQAEQSKLETSSSYFHFL
ncbi:hypothetical protein PVAP13_8NG017300 [Panicum virgatum]|uniref:Uncharacterized protein n=1 Tax=Panicum virgatum TaxID=38727 RepID=A0A8T0P0T9_PANVG|nr:hypothetical protein PVAP13_8NG017300 [Panicum virgatum]